MQTRKKKKKITMHANIAVNFTNNQDKINE